MSTELRIEWEFPLLVAYVGQAKVLLADVEPQPRGVLRGPFPPVAEARLFEFMTGARSTQVVCDSLMESVQAVRALYALREIEVPEVSPELVTSFERDWILEKRELWREEMEELGEVLTGPWDELHESDSAKPA